MGSLRYDGLSIEFDDRLLAHLQIVIVQKLRRKEGFVMSWLDGLSVGDGRSSIWLDHTIPIYFKFLGSRSPSLNREWLDLLTASANSSTGLVITDEDGRLARSGGVQV